MKCASPRIAHLILAHKSPNQLAKLVAALNHPRMDCYIHIDAKSSIEKFKLQLGSFHNVYFIKKRVNIQWAGYGTVQATINGFQEILNCQSSYDYIHVMSGQDFPIKNCNYLINFIKMNYGKEFFDYLHQNWPSDIATRYTRYHLINFRFPGRYRLENLLNRILPERTFFFDGPVLGSSNWFMVSKECAMYLVDHIQKNTKLVSYFKFVWGADEFIFINLLMHSPFKDKIDGSGIHYMDWKDGGAHARTLTISDLNELESSRMLFARKFDIDVDSLIIDKLISQE
jgi:hypothetical protein